MTKAAETSHAMMRIFMTKAAETSHANPLSAWNFTGLVVAIVANNWNVGLLSLKTTKTGAKVKAEVSVALAVGTSMSRRS